MIRAKSLLHKARIWANRRFTERELPVICRGQRERCWCGGELIPFRWHPSYGVCAQCRCYVNQRPPLQEEFRRLYSWDSYWHRRQKMKGFPTIEFRSEYDRSDGRLARWMNVITQYGPGKGRVIEIGCGHGVLLAELQKKGYECIGVEIDEIVAAWTQKKTGVKMVAGLFPDIDLPKCDLFMALDVIEHSPSPDTFMRAAAALLKANGIAIIQTPTDHHYSQPPFREIFTNVFDDLEHLFVFAPESLRKLGEFAGLKIIAEATGIREQDIAVYRANSCSI